MIESIDLFFFGFLMIVFGFFGAMFLYEGGSEKAAKVWAIVWVAPPILKLWLTAVIYFITS